MRKKAFENSGTRVYLQILLHMREESLEGQNIFVLIL